MASVQIHMTLKEKEEQAVSLIQERYPHIKNANEAARAALLYLACGELPVEATEDEEWVTIEEAARLLTESSEDRHTITVDHAYRIAQKGHIRVQEMTGVRGRGGIQKRYSAADCRNYHVRNKKNYRQPALTE